MGGTSWIFESSTRAILPGTSDVVRRLAMRVDQLTEHLPAEEIERPKAWTRDTISADRWLIPLSEASVAELAQAVRSLRETPRPAASLAPAAFSLRACSDLMPARRAPLANETDLA